MTDQRRLQDKLQKIAVSAEFSAGRRVLHTGQGGDFLVAILHEIDETILGRLLVFENDNGACIELDAANRHLLRLNQTSGDDALAVHADLCDRQFSDADGAGTSALAALLQVFLAGTKTLHVSAKKLNRTPEVTEIGYSAHFLADAWGIGLYGADPTAPPDLPELPDQSEPFIGYCQDIALAWIRLDSDGKTDQSKKSAALTRLIKLCDASSSAHIKALDGLGGLAAARRSVILGHGPDQQAVLWLQSGSGQLYCLIPGAELAAVIAGWHADD